MSPAGNQDLWFALGITACLLLFVIGMVLSA
jgi:hypothetical protein